MAGKEQELLLRGEYITLGQLLKAVGAVGGGGETKALLESGGVRVNGEAEERRGRKLRAGDRVEIPGAGSVRVLEGPVLHSSGEAGGIEN